MLRDGAQTEDSLQRQQASRPLWTADAPSDYPLLGLPEATVDDRATLGEPGPACDAGAGPQGAVWSCSGCGEPIREPVALSVGQDQRWHPGCLRCDECHAPLAGSASCFLRDGRTLCRADYVRIFAEKCGGCREAVLSTDLVVRAGSLIYHPECLRCCLCGALLMPGDSFTLGPGPQTESRGVVRRRRRRLDRRPGGRVRTVLSDGQLRALRSCYSRTPRPEAEVKLRLSQLTGLSPRVVRVWFQNKRCKDKKNRARRGGGRPAGELGYAAALRDAVRPMVVVSPEPPASAVQITIYESPWQTDTTGPSTHSLTPSADRDDLLLTDRLQAMHSVNVT